MTEHRKDDANFEIIKTVLHNEMISAEVSKKMSISSSVIMLTFPDFQLYHN